MDLNLVRLFLSIESHAWSGTPPLLTGKGFAFEEALRMVCCSQKNQSCHHCHLIQSCSASVLVARQLSKDPELVRRHQKPGLPFVFSQHMHGNQENYLIDLTLLGTACDYLPLFIKALQHGYSNTICSGLMAYDYQDAAIALELDHLDTISNLPVLASAELLTQNIQRFTCCERVRLDLLTPVRLMKDGRELNCFNPQHFIRSLLRRLSSLAVYYGDGVDQEQFRKLAELTASVRLVRQLSGTGDDTSLRGVTGSFELVGPFDELGPYLALGEYLHLGKGAAFGMGAFEVHALL